MERLSIAIFFLTIVFVHDPVFPQVVKTDFLLKIIVSAEAFATKGNSMMAAPIRKYMRASPELDFSIDLAIFDLSMMAGYDFRAAQRLCLTNDFICCDAVRPVKVLTFGARTGADYLNCSSCRLYCCGLFAARIAPSDTIICFLPGLSTNRKKPPAEVLQEHAVSSVVQPNYKAEI
jgi:hypothetical protein